MIPTATELYKGIKPKRRRQIYPTKGVKFSKSVGITSESKFILSAPTSLEGSKPDAYFVLTWVNNSWGETGIEIWREIVEEEALTKIATVAAGVLTYTDDTIEPEAVVTHKYQVRAVNNLATGPFSAVVNLSF